MTLKKLPIRLSPHQLDAPLTNILSRFNVAWASRCSIKLKQGESQTFRNDDSLFDFLRNTVIIVISGHVRWHHSDLIHGQGCIFSLMRWQVAELSAEDDVQLLIARTISTDISEMVDNEVGSTDYRQERRQASRLPTAADLGELLHAFQTGLQGQSHMAFTLLCDQFLHEWRKTYHFPSQIREKRMELAGVTDIFLAQSRQALFGHELVTGQAAHKVLERWIKHWMDF